jgi:Na+-transporting methylmalonyl-CoA/oxaloacetate decarboxylase gamma subunit
MTENLTNALLITVIGMGLVFAAIVLLWAVMAALVRATAERRPAADAAAAAQAEAGARETKRRAAIAAVAVALAREAAGPVAYAPPPAAGVSAWQSVMRGRQLKERGTLRE